MRKEALALGIILLVLGFLLVFTSEEIRIRVEFLPFSTIGILLGVVGIIVLVLTILFDRLADRL